MRVVGDAGTNTLLVTATPADFEHRKRVIDELEHVAANPEADPDEDGGEQPPDTDLPQPPALARDVLHAGRKSGRLPFHRAIVEASALRGGGDSMRLPLVLLLVLAAAGTLRADAYEETERRLKLAGLEEADRERIHEAIRRGVARLCEMQDARGRILPQRSRASGPGVTALAGLALRHAAIPDAVESSHRAIRYLLERQAKTSLAETYPAGLLAMLLAANESQDAFLAKLHDKLAKGPRSSGGYWSYGTSSMKGNANLSTAQFGALGLWAAGRRGLEGAEKAWRTHLDALLRGQEIDGSWAYIQPWRKTEW